MQLELVSRKVVRNLSPIDPSTAGVDLVELVALQLRVHGGRGAIQVHLDARHGPLNLHARNRSILTPVLEGAHVVLPDDLPTDLQHGRILVDFLNWEARHHG